MDIAYIGEMLIDYLYGKEANVRVRKMKDLMEKLLVRATAMSTWPANIASGKKHCGIPCPLRRRSRPFWRRKT